MEQHNVFWEMGTENNSVNSSAEDSGMKNTDRNVKDRQASESAENLGDHFKALGLYLLGTF